MIKRVGNYSIEVIDGIPYRLLKEFKVMFFDNLSNLGGASEMQAGAKVYADVEKSGWAEKFIVSIKKDGKEVPLDDISDEAVITEIQNIFLEKINKALELSSPESKKK